MTDLTDEGYILRKPVGLWYRLSMKVIDAGSQKDHLHKACESHTGGPQATVQVLHMYLLQGIGPHRIYSTGKQPASLQLVMQESFLQPDKDGGPRKLAHWGKET